MPVPIIEVDAGVTLNQWTLDNKHILFGEIYKHIFKFSKQKRSKKTVLKVKTKKNSKILRSPEIGFYVEISLVRPKLNETVDRLIEHYTSIEEYEKCSELLTLKKQLQDAQK